MFWRHLSVSAKSRAISLWWKRFDVQTKAVLLESRGGRRVPPAISSVRAPMICASNSPLFRGGRLPTQPVGSVLPPQDDSGSPARPPCTVARTSSLRATSGTTSPPACAPPPLWLERDACARPDDDRSGPARRRSAPPSVPLPPAESAETDCPVC